MCLYSLIQKGPADWQSLVTTDKTDDMKVLNKLKKVYEKVTWELGFFFFFLKTAYN